MTSSHRQALKVIKVWILKASYDFDLLTMMDKMVAI